MTALQSNSFRALPSLLFGMLCLVTSVEASIQATANPYMEDTCPTDSCRCPALSMNPLAAMTDAALQTQPDTFMKLERKKHMGFELPIYHFKQPGRISHLQLPFKVLPMYSIDQTGIVDIPAPEGNGLDSWFPGYEWSILVCRICEQSFHVGWRYTPTSPSADKKEFFALIVQYGEENKQKSSGNAEVEAEALTIGIPAPSWMAAAAMVMSESKSTAS